MPVDLNIVRPERSSPAERAKSRRKAIYQQIHPETKAGAAQAAGMNAALGRGGQDGHDVAQRYDEAAAEATGHSERTIRRDVTRGKP